MLLFLKKYFFIAIVISCCASSMVAEAQNNFLNNVSTTSQSNKDTSGKAFNKHEYIDNSVNINFTSLVNTTVQYLDSTIYNFQQDKLIANWQQHLGNNYSSVYNLKPFQSHTATRLLGYNTYDAYNLNALQLPLYNTSKPFTIFAYNVASQQLQSGEMLHTQNLGKAYNFALFYNKLGSTGFYKYQNTNQDHAFVTFSIAPDNKKYFDTKIALAYNKNQQDENGGIENEADLTNPDYSLRSVVPTRYSNNFSLGNGSAVTNIYSNFNVVAASNISIIKSKKNKDTSALKPRFALTHTLNINLEKHRYKDLSADTLRYNNFAIDSFKTTDSLYSLHKLNTIDNEFGIALPKISKANIKIDGAFGIQVQKFINYNYSKTVLNNYVKAKLIGSNKNWAFNANMQLFISGQAIGNYMLQGFASSTFGHNKVAVFATQTLTDASWTQQNFESNKFKINNNFNKQLSTQFGGKISNSTYKIEATFTQNTIYNYIYWDSNAIAQQLNAFLIVSQLELNKKLKYKNLIFENNILVQVKNADAPINIPYFTIHQQLSYSRFIFKKSMLANIGLQGNYNSSYYSAAYTPIINNYSYSQSYFQNNSYRLGAFFNAKIGARFKIYILADELLQPLYNLNNYSIFGSSPHFSSNRINVHNYPAQNINFKVGFQWIMIN